MYRADAEGGVQKAEAGRSQSTNVHDPTSFFERNFQDGAGASLRSGLNCDAVEHGENFNPQRNLAPTAHGSTLDTTGRVARIHRAGFDREADSGRQSTFSRDRDGGRQRAGDRDRDRGRSGYDGRRGDDRSRSSNGRIGDRYRSRSRSEDRDRRPMRSNTPDPGGRGRGYERSSSRDRAEQYKQREEDVIRDRPRGLNSEAALIVAGFGIAPRAQNGIVIHLCANCCWLDKALQQQVRPMARKHSMAYCRRPGGGGERSSLDELVRGQKETDEAMVENALRTAGNLRSQRSEALRTGGDQGLNFRR